MLVETVRGIVLPVYLKSFISGHHFLQDQKSTVCLNLYHLQGFVAITVVKLSNPPLSHDRYVISFFRHGHCQYGDGFFAHEEDAMSTSDDGGSIRYRPSKKYISAILPNLANV